MINRELPPNSTFEQAIEFLIRQFNGEPNFHAIVAGVSESGATVMRVSPSGSEAAPLSPSVGNRPTIWSAGVTDENFEVAVGSDAKPVADQMVDIFQRHRSHYVGPPFQFARFDPRQGSRSWEVS